MIFSDTTAALDTALAKAQSDLKPAVKTARGHGYNYAALEEVMEAAIEALSNNGVSFNQGIEEMEEGKMRCITRLAKDGEWIITYCPLRVASKGRNNEMQELGSAFTYARRYALQGIVGIAPITEQDFNKRKALEAQSWGADDDGASSGPKPAAQAKKPKPQAKAQTSNGAPAFAELETIKRDIKKLGADFDLVNDFVVTQAGHKTIKELAESEPGRIPGLITHVSKNIKNFMKA